MKNKLNVPKIEYKVPNLIIIGNIAYDIVDFSRIDANRKNIKDIGGACLFTSIPASLYNRVGMVSKIGNDLELSELYGHDIDLLGVKQIDEGTTKFYTYWNTLDGQNREILGEVSSSMEVGSNDIPNEFLEAKHFHLTTATPQKQKELIEYIRKYTEATISVDTIDVFIHDKECREVFDSVDIAFIDEEYAELINCKAPIKIIKCGKEGAIYSSAQKGFLVKADIIEDVVDKTGAGDCLNGVFLNLILNGKSEEDALEIAVKTATESIKKQGILSLNLKNIANESEER